MPSYYVNRRAQPNGDHEVHVKGCSWFPEPGSDIYVGEFVDCRGALHKAKAYFDQVNGCYYCARQCNTG